MVVWSWRRNQERCGCQRQGECMKTINNLLNHRFHGTILDQDEYFYGGALPGIENDGGAPCPIFLCFLIHITFITIWPRGKKTVACGDGHIGDRLPWGCGFDWPCFKHWNNELFSNNELCIKNVFLFLSVLPWSKKRVGSDMRYHHSVKSGSHVPSPLSLVQGVVIKPSREEEA